MLFFCCFIILLLSFACSPAPTSSFSSFSSSFSACLFASATLSLSVRLFILFVFLSFVLAGLLHHYHHLPMTSESPFMAGNAYTPRRVGARHSGSAAQHKAPSPARVWCTGRPAARPRHGLTTRRQKMKTKKKKSSIISPLSLSLSLSLSLPCTYAAVLELARV